jgi:hypothetical protein
VQFNDLTTILALVVVVAAVAYGLYRRFGGPARASEDEPAPYIVGDVSDTVLPPATVQESILPLEPLAGPGPDTIAGPETALIDPEEAFRAEDERIAAAIAAREQSERIAAQEAARLEAVRAALEEQARKQGNARADGIDAKTLAHTEALRMEEQRLAAAESARAHARLMAEQEAARVAEALRQAEAAARIASGDTHEDVPVLVEASNLIDDDWLATLDSGEEEKVETERQKSERLAAEATARIKARRIAAEDAERLEAERLAGRAPRGGRGGAARCPARGRKTGGPGRGRTHRRRTVSPP